MRPQGLRRFYGDGALVGYRIGPGESVTLIVDNMLSTPREIHSVWLGRVQNFDAACGFLKALGPADVGQWAHPVLFLDLDRATARAPVKHVYLKLSSAGAPSIVIRCKDVAES